MGAIPRSLRARSPIGITARIGRVSAEDFGAATGRALQAAGGEIAATGQRILQREGETLAMEQFAEFQKNELLRFNSEKQKNAANPEGFTDRFLEESKTAFDLIRNQSDNKFFNDIMNSRFAGLTNSLVNSSTSFEANQKIKNQKARYASAVASYGSTVYDDPTMLGRVLNQAAGDATAAAISGVFGQDGINLTAKAGKSIAESAIWGIIDKHPQLLNEFLKNRNLRKLFNGEELRAFENAARASLKTFDDRNTEDRVLQDLAQHANIMTSFEGGTLTTAGITSSSLSDESKVWMIKAITEGDVAAERDPILLDQLWTEKNEIFGKKDGVFKLRETKGFTSKKDEMLEALRFQNKVIKRLGQKKITGAQANSLLRGISQATQAELEKDKSKQGEFSFLGNIKITPDDLAFKSVSQFMKDNGQEQNAFEKSVLMSEILQEFDSLGVNDIEDKEEQRNEALVIIQKILSNDLIDRDPIAAINGSKARVSVSPSGDFTQAIGETKAKPTQTIKSGVIRHTLPNGNIIEIDKKTGNYVVIKGGE